MAAANSIFKLKVETSEYDQKLANAAKGIRHLADVAHKADGDLTGLEKSELDYIRALGEMETKSRSASGQLRELSSTYKELKVVYDQLNEVEKADEGGKALAASLETLKQRAQEAKAQLDSASQSLQSNGEAGKGTSSVMEMLKEKFTVNIDAIKLFNIGLQAAEGALSVAKDAFFASEATVDEWGRVVDSSKSLYEGFLTALNTGDISGYLGRIDEIVTAARRAYDELDRLGTMRTIQAPKISAQQTENERMRMMIQTGRYIAPVDGRRASMKDGQLLTPDQIRRIEAQLQNGMKTVVTLVGNEVKQTGKAIDAVYNRQAQELGMSLKEFRKGTSSMAEFDKRMAGYDQYQKWREQHTTIDMQSGREIVARGNPFEQFAKWGTFRVDGQRYNDLVRLIQQRDQQAGQAYSMQSQAYRTMNRAEGVTVSKLMRGETTGGTTRTAKKAAPEEILQEGSVAALIKQMQELQKQQQLVTSYTGWQEYQQKIEAVSDRISLLKGELPKDKEAVFTVTADTSEALDKLRGIEGVKIDPKDFTVTAETSEALRSVHELIGNLEGTTVQLKVKAEAQDMAIGTSIQNDAGISSYIASIKQQLETADYGTSLYNGLSAQLADMATLQNLVGESLKAGLGTAMFDAADATGKDFWTRAMEGGVEDIDWQPIIDIINEKLKELGIDPIAINFKTGDVKKQSKEMSKDWDKAAGAIQAVGSAMSQIEDPAAKVVGTVAQAVATIALGYANATKMAAETGGPWAWIAFAATGLATMLTTISAIHSATGYAQGGMIKGNSYSGDNIGGMVDGGAGGFVGLNAGEVVLNRAQTGNLASQLQGSGFGNARLVGRLKGRDILISIDRELSATGKGQLATWK